MVWGEMDLYPGLRTSRLSLDSSPQSGVGRDGPLEPPDEIVVDLRFSVVAFLT